MQWGNRMKIALYIEDGLEQIVLTPESETETGILGKIHDGSRELSIKKGSFYHTRGGWQRYQPYHEYHVFGGTKPDGDESTMIVLRAASGTLSEGGDVKQAPGDSQSGPTAEGGDAQ